MKTDSQNYFFNRIRRLGKDSVIYGIGGVLSRGLPFLLLPIYTRIFDPSEYGMIEMLFVIRRFLDMLLVTGTDASQSFYFFEQKENGKQAQAQVITSILQWRILWGTVLMLAAMAAFPLCNSLFFENQLTWQHFAVAYAGCLFMQTMCQATGVFQLRYRAWSYIGLTMTEAVISGAAGILFVVFLNGGIVGYFSGLLLGAACAAAIGWWRLRDYVDFSRLHTQWWPRILRFGMPLLPGGLAMYVLITADRWFINYYHGSDRLGIYAVAALCALMIQLVVNAFRQSWWPLAMDAMHSEQGPDLFRIVARLYVGLMSVGMVLLTAFSPFLLRLFTAPAYHSAYPIIGVLGWHSVFYGFYLISAGGMWKKEKTLWLPIVTGAAALLNIILDIWLVPQFAEMGAAFATTCSFLAWNVASLYVSEKLWPIRYPIGILALMIGVGFAATAGIIILYQSGQPLWQVACITIAASVVLVGISVRPVHFKKIAALFQHTQDAEF